MFFNKEEGILYFTYSKGTSSNLQDVLTPEKASIVSSDILKDG